MTKPRHETVERENRGMQSHGVVHFPEIGVENIRGTPVGFPQFQKSEGFRLLDQRAPAEGFVGRQRGRVADRELLGAEHVDGTWRAAIQFDHPADIRESDQIAVLEGMAVLGDRDQAFLVLRVRTDWGNGETHSADVSDEDSAGLGIIDVADVEGLAEIAENANSEAVVVHSDETNVVSVTDRINRFLLVVPQIGGNDDLCYEPNRVVVITRNDFK